MALHPACHIVEDYLAATFPLSIIEEFEWTAQRSWAFKVSVPQVFPQSHFQLLVSKQFLDKTDDHEIERLLRDWYVANRMRMVGKKEWVYVSASGVSLGVPEAG
jgi:hypothetical protein